MRISSAAKYGCRINEGAMIRLLAISLALTATSAAWPAEDKAQSSSPILESLPAEVQKDIESVRAACREQLGYRKSESFDPFVSGVPRVSSGDDGLSLFTVSGKRAVMVSDLELCGSECFKAANCSNRGSYGIAIYVRSGNAWRKALSTEAVGTVFLSLDGLDEPPKFKAMVVSVFSGNKDCPTHDVVVREGEQSYVFPAWKQSCDAIVKWNGTKFTYEPLLGSRNRRAR
jgi:hypothetical protein